MLPLRLSDASGLPRYRQLYDQIAELIRSGRLAPGALLPSVRALAAETLVSVVTVRRTYADLEAAGLIVRRQGQGTFVRELGEATEREALEEAKDGLREAVERARRLGLDDAAQRDFLSTVWRQG